jgi:molybdenum cofactor guanylyltransferase
MALTGLILAGGKSSRMGFDKAQLDFHGEPQVSWLNSLLEIFCGKIFVSGSPANIPGGFDFIEDRYESGGPLNGILSAWYLHPTASWLVVPVDMPNVNREVVSLLVQGRTENREAVYFLHPTTNLIEPLPLILEPSAYPNLLKQFQQGNTSLNSFLKAGSGIPIIIQDPAWLLNINSPSEMAVAFHPKKK